MPSLQRAVICERQWDARGGTEAIRRAVLGHRDSVLGIPPERRAERVQLLHRLFGLFEGHDAAEEVRRLKEQDEGF